MRKTGNRLQYSSSPYLLQHSHNSVDWYPWGDEAFDKAKKENKPVLVSIGYSACHWCHVMERESFMDEEIATVMNKHFVCIKVDREERPDVDQLYMNAVQMIKGQGGWPLNCFTLPDKKPFFGGTYFTPESWLDILYKIADINYNNPERLKEQTEAVLSALENNENITNDSLDISKDDYNGALQRIQNNFDMIYGGTKGAPKFPIPGLLKLLAEHYYMTKNEEFKNALFVSLEKMAAGGIHDHIGGGFARYSVDSKWHVPHFEKMLYDNAQLLEIYSIAWQIENRKSFKNAALGIIAWLEREMKDKDGGYYAAIDADSEGIEGKFYIWDRGEINLALGDEAEMFCRMFDVRTEGNWEGSNVLNTPVSNASIAKGFGLTEEETEIRINNNLKTLLHIRNKRVKPLTDSKIILSWNALLIKALTQAYKAFGEEEHLNIAIELETYLSTNLVKEHKAYRCISSGSLLPGFLDDYAFTVDALTALYDVSHDESYLYKSRKLTDYALKIFRNPHSSLFFYSSDEHDRLPVRHHEVTDNVIPSSNAVFASILRRLGYYFSNNDYTITSTMIIKSILPQAIKHPLWHFATLSEYHHILEPLWELVISGKNAENDIKEVLKYYNPKLITAGISGDSRLEIFQGRKAEEETLYHVCRGNTCLQPLNSTEMLLKKII